MSDQVRVAMLAWRRSVSALSGIQFTDPLENDSNVAPGNKPRSMLSLDIDPGHADAANVDVGYTLVETLHLDEAGDAKRANLKTYERLLVQNLGGKAYFSDDVVVHSHHLSKPESGLLEGAKALQITWRGRVSWREAP